MNDITWDFHESYVSAMYEDIYAIAVTQKVKGVEVIFFSNLSSHSGTNIYNITECHKVTNLSHFLATAPKKFEEMEDFLKQFRPVVFHYRDNETLATKDFGKMAERAISEAVPF